MNFMQLLLTNIRASFDEDKQKIGDFLDKVNRDGLKASDYCWKTKHRQFAVVLQEFVNQTEQTIITVKKFEIQEDYNLNGK